VPPGINSARGLLLSIELPFRAVLIIFVALLSSRLAPAWEGPLHPLAVAEIPRHANALVIGFVGGRVARSDSVHGEVQMAARLQSDYPSGVQVMMFENRHGDEALHTAVRFLDTNADGVLSALEKSSAQIAIYGHSWGASETVTLARALGKEGIPVLLTVQVDSVTKPGEDDGAIPANVLQAVNFYQKDGLLHGRSEIHADDSSRTKILGSFLTSYRVHPVNCDKYPWFARTFMRSHIEIESDPKVWGRVESLIRSKLPAPHD